MKNIDWKSFLQECTVRLNAASTCGTGFFVGQQFILTCAHVIESAQNQGKDISVIWKDNEYSAQIIKYERDLDVAILKIIGTSHETITPPHPCVRLDKTEPKLHENLYIFGYPRNDYARGDSITLSYEGLSNGRNKSRFLKLKGGQVERGFSGAPILNSRGRVCGIIRLSRDLSSDLGGRGVPMQDILLSLPEILHKNQQFHRQKWKDSISELITNINSYIVPITSKFSIVMNWILRRKGFVSTLIVIIILMTSFYLITYQKRQAVNEALTMLKSGKGTGEQIEFLVRESKAGYRNLIPTRFQNLLKLQNLLLGNCSLAGFDLGSIDLTARDLQEANFSGVVFYGAKFLAANLRGANFWNASLTKVDFRSADLRGADFFAASLQSANLHGAKLDGANLLATRLVDIKVISEDLKYTCNWEAAIYNDDEISNRRFIKNLENTLLVVSLEFPDCQKYKQHTARDKWLSSNPG
jgi:hypothetical protein